MVKVRKDLTGLRFGKLLVLEQAEDKIRPNGDHIAMWKCICDCQQGSMRPKYFYIEGVQLQRSKRNVTSCGCETKEIRRKASTRDLTGMRFGRLTVIELYDYVWNGKNYNARWKCICDCQVGLENPVYTYVVGNSLTSGNTQSCGCYGKEKLLESLHARKTPNKYKNCGDYYIGYTRKGEKFYFDSEDYDLIKDYKWYTDEGGYIVSHVDKDIYLYMHRHIMGFDEFDGLKVDHIRGKESRNDNRRFNLRIATSSQNSINRALQSNNTSGITGVNQNSKTGKWNVELTIQNVRYRYHGINTKEEAILIRQALEDKYFKDWSYDNSQRIGQEALQKYEDEPTG